MTEKTRSTVSFDPEIFEMVLALRAKPEYARMSVSRLVNMLLARALTEAETERRRG